MIVSIKDASKLIGISIISCCAVFVCTMFLNFYFDIRILDETALNDIAAVFYKAQVSTSKVIICVSGGCLMLTAAVMLIFYIRHYINIHKKELGILKAMGYSRFKTAKSFYVFGISIFTGAATGFGGAFIIMPAFYRMQNKYKILPEITVAFHPQIFLYFVIFPTIGFSVLAVLYAFTKLKNPVIMLLKDSFNTALKTKSKNIKTSDITFIKELKRTALHSNKTLAFFIIFAAFCFSAMTQMSASMNELSSAMMSAIMLLIGFVLACTTLFISISTVVNGNTKTVAVMRVFGYSQRECRKTLLDGYRPLSYLGFLIGTVYQYALLRVMVDVVFKGIDDIPVYKFDFTAFIISLVLFIILYEGAMYTCTEKIKKISVKEIMLE